MSKKIKADKAIKKTMLSQEQALTRETMILNSRLNELQTEASVLRTRLATAETRVRRLEEEIAAAADKPPVVVEKRIERERLPKRRRKHTFEFVVGESPGTTRVFIEVGLYPDGRPGEVFINTSKPGSDLRAFMSGFSICVSLLLQQGVPVARIAHSLEDLAGGPSGDVLGHDSITKASSIVDLVVRLLRHEYGSA